MTKLMPGQCYGCLATVQPCRLCVDIPEKFGIRFPDGSVLRSKQDREFLESAVKMFPDLGGEVVDLNE